MTPHLSLSEGSGLELKVNFINDQAELEFGAPRCKRRKAATEALRGRGWPSLAAKVELAFLREDPTMAFIGLIGSEDTFCGPDGIALRGALEAGGP